MEILPGTVVRCRHRRESARMDSDTCSSALPQSGVKARKGYKPCQGFGEEAVPRNLRPSLPTRRGRACASGGGETGRRARRCEEEQVSGRDVRSDTTGGSVEASMPITFIA